MPQMLFGFQFPFRRDELCNRYLSQEGEKVKSFQFPFRRDELCNDTIINLHVDRIDCFNSLFVGMSFAMRVDQNQVR